MNTYKRSLAAGLSLFAFWGVCHSLRAQSIYGGLRGLVKDAQSAVVTGARVTMTDEATNLSRSTITNETGEYHFASVTPATYTVVTEAPGFKKFERRSVTVATQQSATLDVQMELGAVTESVMVTGEVALIESATASQGQVVDHQKLIDLPNLGRNPFMMSRLAATVQQVGNPAYNRMQDQSGSSHCTVLTGDFVDNTCAALPDDALVFVAIKKQS